MGRVTNRRRSGRDERSDERGEEVILRSIALGLSAIDAGFGIAYSYNEFFAR